MKKQQRCYIYTRVSTSMQVDGYSLDAQKDKLHKYADYQNMIIAGEYSDEGKSGKSVDRKPVLPTSKPTAWITSIFYPALLNVLFAEVVCMEM